MASLELLFKPTTLTQATVFPHMSDCRLLPRAPLTCYLLIGFALTLFYADQCIRSILHP